MLKENSNLFKSKTTQLVIVNFGRTKIKMKKH